MVSACVQPGRMPDQTATFFKVTKGKKHIVLASRTLHAIPTSTLLLLYLVRWVAVVTQCSGSVLSLISLWFVATQRFRNIGKIHGLFQCTSVVVCVWLSMPRDQPRGQLHLSEVLFFIAALCSPVSTWHGRS